MDIQWYDPAARGFEPRKSPKLAMDAHGRLLPAVERFPSAANGAGFKPLADYVHAKGLKFGIHLMRGIPRQAVEQNTPILGSDARAADIAVTSSTCTWNADMFGVDATKPGGQAYYDSLLALYASWGVDFIKVDDLSQPYTDVQLAEVEAIRKAIDKTGRPIVLSTSPGATPLARGEHIATHANMWRISNDFWDKWPELREQFKRLHDWTPYRAPGAWPDADMLPLGIISFGRTSQFTPDEQRTMMTLWSIARSPLILGADMTKLDTATLALLNNDEVLAMNQASTGNRQLFEKGDLIAWVADVPASKDKYLAVFNTGEAPAPVPVELSTIGFTGRRCRPRSLGAPQPGGCPRHLCSHRSAAWLRTLSPPCPLNLMVRPALVPSLARRSLLFPIKKTTRFHPLNDNPFLLIVQSHNHLSPPQPFPILMNKTNLPRQIAFASIGLLSLAPVLHAADGPQTAPAASSKPASSRPLRNWITTGPLVLPTADESHPIVAVKDPSVVFHNGRWHIFATTAASNGWGMGYLNFTNWDQAAQAKTFTSKTIPISPATTARRRSSTSGRRRSGI